MVLEYTSRSGKAPRCPTRGPKLRIMPPRHSPPRARLDLRKGNEDACAPPSHPRRIRNVVVTVAVALELLEVGREGRPVERLGERIS